MTTLALSLLLTSSVTVVDSKPVLEGTNAIRHASGMCLLKSNPTLDRVATEMAEDMAAKTYLSHTDSKGRSLRIRGDASGYPWTRIAENIAFGYNDGKSVVTAWMESEGHRKNIMNPAFTELGTGAAVTRDGMIYWCEVFGKAE